MIIEILGAKMLAPYVGTSHFVWTAQITVTLVALAAGYYAGGWLADRSARPTPLYTAILVAAVYLCGSVFFVRPAAQACLDFRLAVGSLLASALLFFPPLGLLAMTAPFLVRALTQSLASVGGNVGRLTAISTLGSVVGTLLIGYVLLPLLPNSVTMLLTAGLLAALSAAYFLGWNRTAKTATQLGLLALVGIAFAAAALHVGHRSDLGHSVELLRRNSNFGLLQVAAWPDNGRRYLLNDYLVQNTYVPKEQRGASAFSYVLHDLAAAHPPRVDSVLCIGLGIGLVPREFVSDGARVEVVEINPAVVQIARDYFDCPTDKMRVVIGDGRQFLNVTTNRYDALVLDAFIGDSSPVHLFSREAFQAMRQVLNPGGVLVMNCFADFRHRRDFYGASIEKTLASVFRSVQVHTAGTGNVYFLASDTDPLVPLRKPNFERIHPDVRWVVEASFSRQQHFDLRHGILLTDDFNPVEFHDAANREDVRLNLVRQMESL